MPEEERWGYELDTRLMHLASAYRVQIHTAIRDLNKSGVDIVEMLLFLKKELGVEYTDRYSTFMKGVISSIGDVGYPVREVAMDNGTVSFKIEGDWDLSRTRQDFEDHVMFSLVAILEREDILRTGIFPRDMPADYKGGLVRSAEELSYGLDFWISGTDTVNISLVPEDQSPMIGRFLTAYARAMGLMD